MKLRTNFGQEEQMEVVNDTSLGSSFYEPYITKGLKMFFNVKDPALLKVIEEVALFRDAFVVLCGSTGCGKTKMAELINKVRNNHGPFIRACISELGDNAGVRLFGTKGKFFTGVDASSGYVSAATGGTLFLDEIGSATQSIQQLLLRFLEVDSDGAHRYTVIGETDERVFQGDLMGAMTIEEYEGMKKDNKFINSFLNRIHLVKYPEFLELSTESQNAIIAAIIEKQIKIKQAQLKSPEWCVEMDYEIFGLYRSFVNMQKGSTRNLDKLIAACLQFVSLKKSNKLTAQMVQGIIEKSFISIGAEVEESRCVNMEIKARKPRISLKEIGDEAKYQQLIAALRVNNDNKTKTAIYLGIARSELYRLLHNFGMIKDRPTDNGQSHDDGADWMLATDDEEAKEPEDFVELDRMCSGA